MLKNIRAKALTWQEIKDTDWRNLATHASLTPYERGFILGYGFERRLVSEAQAEKIIASERKIARVWRTNAWLLLAIFLMEVLFL